MIHSISCLFWLTDRFLEKLTVVMYIWFAIADKCMLFMRWILLQEVSWSFFANPGIILYIQILVYCKKNVDVFLQTQVLRCVFKSPSIARSTVQLNARQQQDASLLNLTNSLKDISLIVIFVCVGKLHFNGLWTIPFLPNHNIIISTTDRFFVSVEL